MLRLHNDATVKPRCRRGGFAYECTLSLLKGKGVLVWKDKGVDPPGHEIQIIFNLPSM